MAEALDILHFLNVLEGLPCLWWKNHPKYKIRSARDTAEDFLLDTFKVHFKDKVEIRKKIRNIRNGYNQEITKIKKSTTTGTSPDMIYTPKLFWFEEANRFLSKNLREAPCQFSSMVNEEGENASEQETEMNRNDESALDIESVNNFVEADEIQEELIELNVTDLSTVDNTKRKRKAVDHNKIEQSTLLKLVEVLESLQQQRVSKTSKTEFAVFGESVGKQLEDLPKKDAIRLQLEIQTLISNYRLRILDENL